MEIIKRIILTFIFVILFMSVIFSFCLSKEDPFDPSDIATTSTPQDWITPDRNINHVKIEAINKKKVPARQISLPESQSPELLLPTEDGGCLAVSQIPVDEKMSKYYLRVIFFKADGTIKWDQQYKEDLYQGYPTGMCVFTDGGFAISLRISNGDVSEYIPMDILYRFSPNGTKIWNSEEEQVLTGSFEYLFAMTDGAVITAGTITTLQPDGSFGENEICLIKYDMNGKMSKQLTLGIEGYDYLSNASYSVGTGIVISWMSETKETENSGDAASQQISSLGCFDENLNEKWISVLQIEDRIYNIEALPENEGILAFGWTLTETARSALFYFNDYGVKNWIYSVEEENCWIRTAVRLGDDRFVGGKYQVLEDREQTTLFTLSNKGENIHEIDLIPGIIEQIKSTKDGGFTVLIRQKVSAIPQPMYVSSIWTDTEAIVAHYDKDLELIWRRTIDQYKHELRTDKVVFTVEDRLLIG